jgi:hypothetical protein
VLDEGCARRGGICDCGERPCAWGCPHCGSADHRSTDDCPTWWRKIRDAVDDSLAGGFAVVGSVEAVAGMFWPKVQADMRRERDRRLRHDYGSEANPVYHGDQPYRQAFPDTDPWVCDRCGQRLPGPGERCNSGIHVGPDDDAFNGVAVRLSASSFIVPNDGF